MKKQEFIDNLLFEVHKISAPASVINHLDRWMKENTPDNFEAAKKEEYAKVKIGDIKPCKSKHLLSNSLPWEMALRLNKRGFDLWNEKQEDERFTLDWGGEETNWIRVEIRGDFIESYCMHNGDIIYNGDISNIAFFEELYTNTIEPWLNDGE